MEPRLWYGRPPPLARSLTDVWLCFGLLGKFTESRTGGKADRQQTELIDMCTVPSVTRGTSVVKNYCLCVLNEADILPLERSS